MYSLVQQSKHLSIEWIIEFGIICPIVDVAIQVHMKDIIDEILKSKGPSTDLWGKPFLILPYLLRHDPTLIL